MKRRTETLDAAPDHHCSHQLLIYSPPLPFPSIFSLSKHLRPLLSTSSFNHVNSIVGRNLLAAMVEVLGEQTATKEVVDGWAEAYGFLADVLIAREKAIYDELAAMPGGWNGKRKFKIVDKFRKSEHICSLVLKPEDGKELPLHKPGQYTTIYPGDSMDASLPRPIAPRNYTISNSPGSGEWRITVKREAEDGKPAGIYSNWIHDTLKIGDTVDMGPPVGCFFLDEAAIKQRPAIFVGGGVGLTPCVPMIAKANKIAPEQSIFWFYSAGNSAMHPLIEEEVEELARNNKNIHTLVAYDRALPDDHPDVLGRYTAKGIMHMSGMDGKTDLDVYMCGPPEFMKKMYHGFKEIGIPEAQIHGEFFGPARQL